MKSIDKKFSFLINNKLREVILTVLDEKEENLDIVYNTLDSILICNHNNDLDLKFIVETVKINKYFFYLFKK